MIIYKGHGAVTINVNGVDRKIVIKPSETLLVVLREKLGLWGAKSGCENGDCGACTVLLNDKLGIYYECL